MIVYSMLKQTKTKIRSRFQVQIQLSHFAENKIIIPNTQKIYHMVRMT